MDWVRRVPSSPHQITCSGRHDVLMMTLSWWSTSYSVCYLFLAKEFFIIFQTILTIRKNAQYKCRLLRGKHDKFLLYIVFCRSQQQKGIQMYTWYEYLSNTFKLLILYHRLQFISRIMLYQYFHKCSIKYITLFQYLPQHNLKLRLRKLAGIT